MKKASHWTSKNLKITTNPWRECKGNQEEKNCEARKEEKERGKKSWSVMGKCERDLKQEQKMNVRKWEKVEEKNVGMKGANEKDPVGEAEMKKKISK